MTASGIACSFVTRVIGKAAIYVDWHFSTSSLPLSPSSYLEALHFGSVDHLYLYNFEKLVLFLRLLWMPRILALATSGVLAIFSLLV